MRSARALLLAAFAGAVVAACASNPKGEVRFDPDRDYSRLRSYAFAPDPERPAQPSYPRLWELRPSVRQAITHELGSKGMQEASADRADFLVSYRVGVRSKAHMGGSMSSDSYAGIAIDLVDPRTHETFWQGWAAETWWEGMDPATEIPKVVTKTLEAFPPPK
jgi:hypothetical protein